jgi:Fur family transcriptional regulator, peroxide stress response regulator
MALKVRKSRQRERIRQLLEAERVHVTANWVFDQLRSEFPNLSLGNVYRNLNILVEQGEANRLPFGSTFDVYEAARDPHCHFVCEQCGSIEDVTITKTLQSRLEESVRSEAGHAVNGMSVDFHGICRACNGRIDRPSPVGGSTARTGARN